MGFLPIFYAAAFFLVALCAWAICSVYTGLQRYSKQAFVVPLAFGACSYLGFFSTVVSLGSLSFTERLFDGRFQALAYSLAYLIPGVAGSWFSLKILKSLRT